METSIKIGVLAETKTPPDRRTAITPEHAVEIQTRYSNVRVVVQSSAIRAYSDDEYSAVGIEIVDNVSDCDILFGVKEVKIEKLIPEKMYFFFSHTAKKQDYNRTLLQAALEKNIRLLDYEYLTDTRGARLVAFGHWAGIVGAYNAMIALGKRTGAFSLKRAVECHDVKEMFEELKKIELPPVKIVLTGGGRVAQGALEVLYTLGLLQVSPFDFLHNSYNEAVITRLDPVHYVARKDGSDFDLNHFFANPKDYVSTFAPYTKVAEMYIACHFWDEDSPVFFTNEDLQSPDFKLHVIADVSCDIAGPIPSTIRSSSISSPFYGFNPKTLAEGDEFAQENITVMAVDNLPGEVPRDASDFFGNGLLDKIFPALFTEDMQHVIERATITRNGKLTEHFAYLHDFANGLE